MKGLEDSESGQRGSWPGEEAAVSPLPHQYLYPQTRLPAESFPDIFLSLPLLPTWPLSQCCSMIPDLLQGGPHPCGCPSPHSARQAPMSPGPSRSLTVAPAQRTASSGMWSWSWHVRMGLPSRELKCQRDADRPTAAFLISSSVSLSS